MEQEQPTYNNKALWIFPNFRETINSLPQKMRGRAWEILIETAFGNENFSKNLQNEKLFVQMAIKSLLPLLRLRGLPGSQNGVSNNPTGRRKEGEENIPNIGANIAPNIGANIGANPLYNNNINNNNNSNINNKSYVKDNTDISNQPSEQPNSNSSAVVSSSSSGSCTDVVGSKGGSRGGGRRRRTFVKPTIDDVKKFCEVEGLNLVDAYKFWKYYEDWEWTWNDSKSGSRKPLENWKRAARGWQDREEKRIKEQAREKNLTGAEPYHPEEAEMTFEKWLEQKRAKEAQQAKEAKK